jgi:hypothetical protein
MKKFLEKIHHFLTATPPTPRAYIMNRLGIANERTAVAHAESNFARLLQHQEEGCTLLLREPNGKTREVLFI